MTTKKSELEESVEFNNLIGEKSKSEKSSLVDLFDMPEEEKQKLTGEDLEWKRYWKGMPEFVQENNPTYKTLYVHFRCEADYQEFAKLIGQKLTEKTKSIWHPKLDRTKNTFLRWVEEEDGD